MITAALIKFVDFKARFNLDCVRIISLVTWLVVLALSPVTQLRAQVLGQITNSDSPQLTTDVTSIPKQTPIIPGKVVTLPSWEIPSGWEQVKPMDSSRAGRVFLDEDLPSLMTRTLVGNAKDFSNGDLSWILTGPRAGLTVAIHKNSVELVERYYDSFALNPEDAKKSSRFPELKRIVCRVRAEGALQAVTLTLDYQASVELFLNGQSVYRGRFAEDISRHQLRLPASTNELQWQLFRPTAKTASVTVIPDPAHRHQTILGWGGITSMPSYYRLSEAGKRQWWQLLCEYGLNIQREYPAGRTLNPDYSNLGSLQAAIHHYYEDNFPNGETVDFDYLRLHRLLPQSEVWFEYWWQLPPWTIGKPEAYAKSIIEYSQRVKDRSGRAPEIIGVQNEHLDADWSLQAKTLRRQLDAAGFSTTHIHMNDNGSMTKGLDWLKRYHADAAAWQAIDYTATHQYDYQADFTKPDKFDATLRQWHESAGDKPFLSTELCINDNAWQLHSYRAAFQMAQQYHKTLTIADASAICYCWLLLDVEQQTFNWTRTLFAVDRENGSIPSVPSHQLRCYAAFSRHIRAGMIRVDAESDNTQLLASAYSGDSGKCTLVLINRSTKPMSVAVSWAGANFTMMERVSQTEPNLLEPFSRALSSIRIEPGEILTLTDVPLTTLPEEFWHVFEKINAK